MREIVTHPDPVLKQKCRALTAEEIATGKADGIDLKELAAEMGLLMRADKGHGVGLAAPQVGVPFRMFIVDAAKTVMVFLNPEVSEPLGSEEMVEGCLSLPGVKVLVKRPAQVTLKATSLDGKLFETKPTGMLARIVQHEFDHIEGRTILTRGNISSKKNREALDNMERVYARWQEHLKKKVDTEPAPDKKEE